MQTRVYLLCSLFIILANCASKQCEEPVTGKTYYMTSPGGSENESDENPDTDCQINFITDASKCHNCSATISINGTYENQGRIVSTALRGDSSILTYGHIAVGCCGSFVTHGIVLGAANSSIDIGDNSELVVTNLKIDPTGRFGLGQNILWSSGLQKSDLHIGSNSAIQVFNQETLSSVYLDNAEIDLNASAITMGGMISNQCQFSDMISMLSL